MTSWFVSDIHLKDINERNGNTLLRFLFFLNQNPSEHQLFLLGDIFDFWISDGTAFTNHYKPLITEFEKFKAGGGKAYYFEGNHDLHLDVFWTKKLDIPVFDKEKYFQIDNLTVRLEHGDFINSDDIAYLKYRALIRHPFVEPLGHFLPSFIWKPLGEKLSQKSRKKTGHYSQKNEEKVRTLIRAYSHKAYEEAPFDLIVTGHMHIQDQYAFQVGSKKVTSINLGTWLDQPCALRIVNNAVEIINLNVFLG